MGKSTSPCVEHAEAGTSPPHFVSHDLVGPSLRDVGACRGVHKSPLLVYVTATRPHGKKPLAAGGSSMAVPTRGANRPRYSQVIAMIAWSAVCCTAPISSVGDMALTERL